MISEKFPLVVGTGVRFVATTGSPFYVGTPKVLDRGKHGTVKKLNTFNRLLLIRLDASEFQ